MTTSKNNKVTTDKLGKIYLNDVFVGRISGYSKGDYRFFCAATQQFSKTRWTFKADLLRHIKGNLKDTGSVNLSF